MYLLDTGLLNVVDPVVGGNKPADIHILCSFLHYVPATLEHVLVVDGIDSELNDPDNITPAVASFMPLLHRMYLVLLSNIDGQNNIISPNKMSFVRL